METKMIGNKIATARKKMNISQAELAKRLFISPQAVGKWERGESMPDIITFNRLAEIMSVDLNYFSEGIQSDEVPSEKQKKKLGWDMTGGNWEDADFSSLENLPKKFNYSNLKRCLFVGSDLSGLLLKGNQIVSCDLTDSDISCSHIQGSHLVNNKFSNCSLKETKFSGNHIKGCDFSGANFTGATIIACDISKNKMLNADWNHTSFIATKIVDIVFEGTLEDCSFENCSFKKVIFQKAVFINNFFKNKSLKGIQFIDCQVDRMTYEFLKSGKADLSGLTLFMP